MNTEENNFEGFEDNQDLKFEGENSSFIEQEFQEDGDEKEFDVNELEGIGPDLVDFSDTKDKEEENKEEEEEENPFEEKKIDKEDVDFDLEALNKKFGTDFQKEEDLKNFLKKGDEQEEVDQEKINYEKERDVVPVYAEWLSWDDEKLVRETLSSQAAQDGRNINSEEVIEEIDSQIQSLKDSNLLKSQAGPIRMNINNVLQKSQAVINNYEKQQELSIEETKKANNEQLQNALVSLTKEGFLGIVVDKKELGEVYNDIKSRKWFDKINSSQEGIAKLALIDRYYDKIVEMLGKPTQSDGIAKTLSELGIKGSRAHGLASRVLKDTANGKSAIDISNFVK